MARRTKRAAPGRRKVAFIVDPARRASAATNLRQTIMRKMYELEIKCGTQMLVAFLSPSRRLKTFAYGPSNWPKYKRSFDDVCYRVFSDLEDSTPEDLSGRTREELRSIYRSVMQSLYHGKIPTLGKPDTRPDWMPPNLWMNVERMTPAQLRAAISAAEQAFAKRRKDAKPSTASASAQGGDGRGDSTSAGSPTDGNGSCKHDEKKLKTNSSSLQSKSTTAGISGLSVQIPRPVRSVTVSVGDVARLMPTGKTPTQASGAESSGTAFMRKLLDADTATTTIFAPQSTNNHSRQLPALTPMRSPVNSKRRFAEPACVEAAILRSKSLRQPRKRHRTLGSPDVVGPFLHTPAAGWASSGHGAAGTLLIGPLSPAILTQPKHSYTPKQQQGQTQGAALKSPTVAESFGQHAEAQGLAMDDLTEAQVDELINKVWEGEGWVNVPNDK